MDKGLVKSALSSTKKINNMRAVFAYVTILYIGILETLIESTKTIFYCNQLKQPTIVQSDQATAFEGF